ncbi:hypothetical protein BW261_13645 [Klebsiella aerogenes]|nr:hypothetical protein BW261_13645 [Klebsiella aerogenes]PYZ44468.1 hypothetical protein DNK66_00560 [Klebsiella aerogenes]RSV91964.1 hypothetical protein EGH55_14240 [Klebsiella aerogenes]
MMIAMIILVFGEDFVLPFSAIHFLAFNSMILNINIIFLIFGAYFGDLYPA